MPFHVTDDPQPFELDDMRADLSEHEDTILGLEHDLEQVAEVLRALGAGLWGPSLDVGEPSIELTEDQRAVVERLLLL